MSRHAAAIAIATKVSKSDTPAIGAQGAANDAAARANDVGPVPQYTVSTAAVAKLHGEAMALDPSAVKPLPRKVDEYLTWAEQIQGRAWRDQKILARVAVGGRPVTRAEIDALGVGIEWARAIVADERAGVVTPEGAAAMPTPKLAAQLEEHQRLVHNGLMLAFKNDPAKRRELGEAARVTSKAKRSARSALLLMHVARPGIEAELRALPCGEGAAIDALRVLHPEWAARLKNDANEREQSVVTLAERAVALLRPMLDRVLWAGRYLAKSMPGHEGTYPGFRVGPKRRAKKPQPPKPPAAPR
jgi:hypothetical protein